jgi:hypothetical protein
MLIDKTRQPELDAALRKSARPQSEMPEHPAFHFSEGYERRSHPDLIEKLQSLQKIIPLAQLTFVYGVAVLATPGNLVFAVARSMRQCSFLLPDTHAWGEPDPEYGPTWRAGDAWFTGNKSQHGFKEQFEDELRSTVKVAFAHALKTEGTEIR